MDFALRSYREGVLASNIGEVLSAIVSYWQQSFRGLPQIFRKWSTVFDPSLIILSQDPHIGARALIHQLSFSKSSSGAVISGLYSARIHRKSESMNTLKNHCTLLFRVYFHSCYAYFFLYLHFVVKIDLVHAPNLEWSWLSVVPPIYSKLSCWWTNHTGVFPHPKLEIHLFANPVISALFCRAIDYCCIEEIKF